jgi:hypothetical protein
MADVVWLHYALARTAWYELDPGEREKLGAAWDEARAASVRAGARTEGGYDVRGQGDYSTVEVWFFPDADAAFDHWSRLVDAGYQRWFEASNAVGAALAARS